MSFGEKLLNARVALNLTQNELAKKIGVSQRSVYSYEKNNIIPRKNVLMKIAESLFISIAYLLDETESDKYKNIDQDFFLANVKNEFGNKAVKEASEILSRASVLFAGGELDDETKDAFFQSLMEVYLESKNEARGKFGKK